MTDHAAPPTWTRVIVLVVGDDAELVADLLWSEGPAAIEERTDPDGVLLLAGFDDAEQAELAARAVADHALVAPRLEPVVDDGLDGWRAHARTERAGRFLVHPPWLPPPTTRADDLVLLVDPGRSFGSGSHPTSRLVLALLPDLVRVGDRVLDVGCGSGVLAVGAALLGAGEVLGIDIDPASPAATRDNAERNRVGGQVTATDESLARVARSRPPHRLVLANLLAPVIVALGPDLVAATEPGGHLVVSGLLADRWEEAVGVIPDVAVRAVVEDDGWVAVVLDRSGAATTPG